MKSLLDIIQQYAWERVLMAGIAARYREPQIGEIGFGGGRSTLLFLEVARELGGHVYSIEKEPSEKAIEAVAGYDEQFTLITGDSRETDFPVELDVLFIDGDHSYEGVEADFHRHIQRVRAGGVCFLHDPVSYAESVGRFCREMDIPTILVGGAGLGVVPVL